MAYENDGTLVNILADGSSEAAKRLKSMGIGSYDAFEEHQQVLEWINDIPDTAGDDYKMEQLRQHFEVCMDQYQEQPHLLDPHLPQMLKILITMIRNPRSGSDACRHAAAAFAEHLIKIRKPKVVVRSFPHEVQDLEPVLSLMESQKCGSIENW